MSNSDLYTNGQPDFAKLQQRFAAHQEGRLGHITSEGHQFLFEIKRVGNSYDAIILEQPSYGARSHDLHVTHRLPSEGNRYKICFARPAPDTPTAICLAMYWADCTSRYIRDGRGFG